MTEYHFVDLCYYMYTRKHEYRCILHSRGSVVCVFLDMHIYNNMIIEKNSILFYWKCFMTFVAKLVV